MSAPFEAESPLNDHSFSDTNFSPLRVDQNNRLPGGSIGLSPGGTPPRMWLGMHTPNRVNQNFRGGTIAIQTNGQNMFTDDSNDIGVEIESNQIDIG